MKKVCLALALASMFHAFNSAAVSFDDVQFWTGTGTNRAALVVQWSAPESSLNSSVPAPIADKTLVWGYRFNGTATGTEMLTAILAADPRFYVVADTSYGSTFIVAIGFSLSGAKCTGITDGSVTNHFTNNFLTTATVDIDAARPLSSGDLYWGGYWGPNWETWTETGDAGGYLNSPNRGTNAFWTSTDPVYSSSGYHGQWELAQMGLDSLPLTNGSWIGLSVAAGEYDAPATSPYNLHKHAPATPDAGITALIHNLTGGFQGSQWRVQFLSCTNWLYSLERSVDQKNWTPVATGISGNGTNVVTGDNFPPAEKAYYRIRAERP